MSAVSQSTAHSTWLASVAALRPHLDHMFAFLPGLILAVIVATAARFSAEQLGGPPTIHALAFGLLLGFLASEPTCRAGLDFAARPLMRFGIALLGLQLSLATLAALGPIALISIVLIVSASILIGFIFGKLLGFETQLALLAACATSICGATAAMAVSAVLPQGTRLHAVKCMIIATIALLSTTAMLAYPVLLRALGMSDSFAGFVLGASIHDVAQVVSAGYSMSDQAGEMATVVKLVRVACLLPLITLLSWWFGTGHSDKSESGSKPALLPRFMIGFAALMILNSILVVPHAFTAFASGLSRWCLLIAVAAIGVQTSMRHMIAASGRLVVLLVLQTALLLSLALGAVLLMKH